MGDQSAGDSSWRVAAARWLSRPLLRLPAIRALAIQILSLVFAVLLLMLLPMMGFSSNSVLILVLVQCACAALLTVWTGMERWWVLIQIAFFPALYAAANLQLDPRIYLAAFLLFLFLYWGSYRTRVPFYPSGNKAWVSVAGLLPPMEGLRVVDIGSGFGGMVFHLARSRPDCLVVGVELAPLPCYFSKLAAWLKRSEGRILHGDYHDLDLAEFDVVFAYLSPAAMPDLWSKARREMRPGTLLLSYEFAIPGIESQFTNISHDDPRILHGWHM